MLTVTLYAPKNNGDPVPPTLQVTATAGFETTPTVAFVLVDEAGGAPSSSIPATFNLRTGFWEAPSAGHLAAGHTYTVVASATISALPPDSGSDAKIHCKAP
jgi:hypothetical protein